MTALQAIQDAIETAAKGWKVETGYGADVADFLAENRSTGKLVFVSVGPDTPSGVAADGCATRFETTYSVYVRARASKRDDSTGVHAVYRAIRAALNRLEFKNDAGGRSTITIVGGQTMTVGDYIQPQLVVSSTEPA